MLPENDNKARILIADDEPLVRKVLLELLSENYECVDVASAEEALARLATETFQLVISDIHMPGISGLEMIPRVIELDPDTAVIMISGQQNIESAIKAMRAGSFDYITKPFSFDHVEAVVRRAVDYQMMRRLQRHYESHLEEVVAARTAELQRTNAELEQQIIERERAEEKANYMAYFDALTDLPNPTLFRDRLTHELCASDASRQKSAIIFLALDRFKNINDTLGHSVGDQLLCAAARRLSRCVSKTDTAAYFGGDEFAILLTDVSCAEDTAKVAQNIKDALLPPFNCEGHELYVTTSMGISLYPDDASDSQTLLKNASTALYRVKQRGGDSYQFYTADMHDRALKRLSLENNLRRAIEQEEFVIYYQPQVSADGSKFIGMEALVRWNHPKMGIVPPSEFIPIAEETGLIVPLGDWILRSACAQSKRWQRLGLPALRLSVNLSLRQFQQNNLVETVSAALLESGLEPEFLELELTESAIMHDAKQAIDILQQLRALGIKISVDDFGSGYSSLSYLKTLPIDVLKIDQTFVRDITTDLNDVAIVKTIVSLAHNLNLKTIAEGVETAEQAAVLFALGCDEMQGYFFSKPLRAADLEFLLSDQKSGMFHQRVAPSAPELHIAS
jgi:diguanylate cyclase (GGDEF)-like protein